MVEYESDAHLLKIPDDQLQAIADEMADNKADMDQMSEQNEDEPMLNIAQHGPNESTWSDDEPLINVTNNGELEESNRSSQNPYNDSIDKVRSRKGWRSIIIEPVMLMFALFGYPFIPLSQQFVYSQIENRVRSEMYPNITNLTFDVDTICKLDKSDPEFLLRSEVQSQSSYFMLYLGIASAISSFFATIFIGAYSDKVGRRYALIAPVIGCVIQSLGFVILMWRHASIWWLLLPYFLAGFTGGEYVMFTACFAYIADITTHENRSFRITIVEMCILVSAFMSSIGAGVAIQQMGFFYPFVWVSLGFFILFVYIVFLVPETIRKDPTAKFFDLTPFKTTAKLFVKQKGSHPQSRIHIKIWLLSLSFFFMYTVIFGGTVDTYFELNAPLCWTSTYIGIFTGMNLFVKAAGGLLVLKILQRWLTDIWIIHLAAVSVVAQCVYKAFVTNTAMMFLAPFIGVMVGLFSPSLRALLSKIVQPDELGAILGAISSVEVLCRIIGTAIFNPVYAASQSFFPGLAYLAMAIFAAIGLIPVLVYIYKFGEHIPPSPSQLVEEDHNSSRSIN